MACFSFHPLWLGSKIAANPSTIRFFYGKFGKGNLHWKSVCRRPGAVRLWMHANRRKLKRLKFGNHRKYETNNPDSAIGTPAVIRSFVEWVRQTAQDSPYEALCVVAKGKTPEIAFDNAYKGISVARLGRTGRFDFLCLLGNLGLLQISPPHCYLAGGTGPKMGAIQMVTGKRSGQLTAEVDQTIRRFRKDLGVRVEAMEDALCNWQKHPKSNSGAAEGYVTSTCR